MFSETGSPGEKDINFSFERINAEPPVDGVDSIVGAMQVFRDTHPDLVEGVEYVLYGNVFDFNGIMDGLQKKGGCCSTGIRKFRESE